MTDPVDEEWALLNSMIRHPAGNLTTSTPLECGPIGRFWAATTVCVIGVGFTCAAATLAGLLAWTAVAIWQVVL